MTPAWIPNYTGPDIEIKTGDKVHVHIIGEPRKSYDGIAGKKEAVDTGAGIFWRVEVADKSGRKRFEWENCLEILNRHSAGETAGKPMSWCNTCQAETPTSEVVTVMDDNHPDHGEEVCAACDNFKRAE